MRDFLAAFRQVEPDDAEQHGILGMKWGRRRSEAELTKATAARKASGEEVTPTKKAAAVTPGSETASAKYARLTGEAKGGGQTNWSEEDLKFYNSRTDALAKVNKLYETNPSWLSATSKKVLLNSTQKTMQDISNGIANKYITAPVLDAITTKAGEAAKK
jgi:hypothetical protein